MKKFMKPIAYLVLGVMFGGIALAGLETVTHIQDLNASWPLGSDLASTSDDHIRNIKSALKTDFPNFNGTYTSAAAPVFAIPSDTNTGMYSVAADDLGFSAGGTLRFDISTTAFTGTLPWRGQDGTVGAPAVSFSGDTDTGMYRVTTNIGALSAAGTQVLSFRGDLANVQAGIADGSAAVPSLGFQSNSDLGMYRINATAIGFAAGGTRSFAVATSQALFQDGSAGAPGASFGSDTDTGFYRDTANQIGVALGGSGVGQFISGSFTGTLTGVGSGSGTLFYRCGMSTCTISTGTTAQILGTSNSTSFTITGVPSAAQSTSGACVPTLVINSGSNSSGLACLSGGTITFHLLSAGGNTYSSTGFTNSGNKGVSSWSITYSTL